MNAPVTGYTIEMLNNDLEVLRTTSIGVDQMVHTFDGLTGGTIYILRVAAINGVGQGGWSNIVNITTAPEGMYATVNSIHIHMHVRICNTFIPYMNCNFS